MLVAKVVENRNAVKAVLQPKFCSPRAVEFAVLNWPLQVNEEEFLRIMKKTNLF